jgi:tripartite-type tricarboxylate transporter receptor subunit TctC
MRLVVGFPPGGPVDAFARMMGQWLSERLGQPFIIENRPGAGGNIAADAVAKAPPDGYTLLQIVSSYAINSTLYPNLSYNLIRDIASVASLYRDGPALVVVNAPFPAKTLPEFIAYAKSNPGRINMGSAGVGTPPHVYAELFKSMAGVDLFHVPYRGGPQLLAGLAADQVQVIFDIAATVIGPIHAGALRALAVTTAARMSALPDIPTVAEFVPGYEASGWQGIGAPKHTPREIIEKLNSEINAGLADTTMKRRFAEMGYYTPSASSPAEFDKLMADEVEKWGKVIRAANIKPE